MSDYVIGILLVLVLLGGGATLLVFAPNIQSLVLRYSPPAWYEPTWRSLADGVIRNPSYVIGLRILGLLMMGMGILFAIAIARGRAR